MRFHGVLVITTMAICSLLFSTPKFVSSTTIGGSYSPSTEPGKRLPGQKVSPCAQIRASLSANQEALADEQSRLKALQGTKPVKPDYFEPQDAYHAALADYNRRINQWNYQVNVLLDSIVSLENKSEKLRRELNLCQIREREKQLQGSPTPIPSQTDSAPSPLRR